MDIRQKLTDLGIPEGVVNQLMDKYGDSFLDQVKKQGIETVLDKAGVDKNTLDGVDLTGAMNAYKEFMGEDVDGDGKTGIMEAVDTAKKSGIFGAIKNLFSSKE